VKFSEIANRLTQAVVPGTNGGTTTFRYDPFGRRIQKSGPLGTTNYLYDGNALVGEVDGGGNLVTRYAEGQVLDETLAELRSGTTSYYQQDALGSVTSLSTPSAVLSNAYTFDSFGKLTTSTGTIPNPFQYTGRDSDPETGVYYYRARYYDPASGRFLSADPMRFHAGPNFYSYVQNAPTEAGDPLGLVQMNYRDTYNILSFWDLTTWWQAGGVSPNFSWHGVCTELPCGKYKLNLTISIHFVATTSSEWSMNHEYEHIQIAKAYFDRNKSHYEALERIFGSQAECGNYVNTQMNPDVENQINKDLVQLNKEQDAYDGFFGWIFH
jgi:RHS repeat-associated protein